MSTSGPTQMADVPRTAEWLERPWLARLVRAAVFAAPAVVSIAVTRFAVKNTSPFEIGVNRWVWAAGIAVVSLTVFVLTDRLARQFLPLATLLQLSLAFPQEAPSRFQVAMRSTTTQSAKRMVESHDALVGDEAAYLAQMLELVAALSRHDRLTRGHMERVKAYSELIGQELGLPAEDLNRLRWAALLHDVGKLKVPPAILQKAGRPTSYEWEILKTHPAESVLLLAPLSGWLGNWRHAADQHHERWDGAGYPKGLRGNEIDLAGRIVAVADAYDVMTSTRSYKRPLPASQARAELARCAGTQFDPVVVRAFLNVSVARLRLVLGPVSWLANLPAALSALAPVASPVATGLTALSIAAGTIGVSVDPGIFDATREEVAVARADATALTTTVEGLSSTTTTPSTTGASNTASPSTTGVPSATVPTTGTPSTTAPAPGAVLAANLTVSGTEDEPVALELRATGGSGTVVFALAGTPSSGIVELGASSQDGSGQRRSAVYRPAKDFFGSDSFSYRACDESDRCADAAVVVAVAPVNDPPVPAPVSRRVPRNGSIDIKPSELISGAIDVEGDAIAVVSISNGEKGTVTSDGNGGYRYSARLGMAGRDVVPFVLGDSRGATASAVLTIDISGAQPSAVPDSLSALQNLPTVLPLTANDTDPDGGPLSVVAAAVSPGSVVIEGGIARFTPPLGFVGTASGTYTVADIDGMQASSTFTVSVGAPVALYSGNPRGIGEDRLDGAVLWGLVWFYLEPAWTDIHIEFVDFWIDGTYLRRDDAWTFDATATPFDTATLSNGVHLLRMNIQTTLGTSIYRETPFTVDNS